MQRRILAGILFLAIAPSANAAVDHGPAGDAFYTPPSKVPSGHGKPIWQRKLTGPAVLKSAKSNTLLLYTSTGIDGKTVAVSGDVAVPKGKAPKGGWPVITWRTEPSASPTPVRRARSAPRPTTTARCSTAG